MSDLKRRVKRIDSAYYAVRDPIARWKVWLAATAIVLCGGWLVVEAVSELSPRLGIRFQTDQRLYSRGPLSRPHASWNDRCDVCHESFTPLSAQAEWTRELIGGISTPNAKCESCHAGAIHHPNMKEPNANCAACHKEHLGPRASLIADMDQACVRCHRDLEAHVADKQKLGSSHARISGFADAGRPDSHPDFRSLEADPGQIKFDHHAHLHPDQYPRLWELERVIQVKDPKRRKEALDRYRRFEKDGLVRLDCSACHVVEAEDTGIAREEFSSYEIASTREHRRYMAPIRFENQCRACHPTLVDRDAGFEIPHGVPPVDVERVLFAFREGDNDKVADDLRRIFPRGEGGYFACGRCHHYRLAEGELRPERIEPALIQEFWFVQGQFDHTAHRAFACELCHPAAAESHKTSDVLILGIDNCRKCHSPGGAEERGFFHGARSDCRTCHVYHNAGHPLQGPGALARGRNVGKVDSRP